MHIGIHHVLLDHIVFDRGVGIDVHTLDYGQEVAHGVSFGGLGGIDEGQAFADALSCRTLAEGCDISVHPVDLTEIALLGRGGYCQANE